MKKEPYVFPTDNWYLKFEECDKELVDNWRINIIKYSDKPCPSNYIDWRGREVWDAGWRGFLISTAQFKEYVLNIKSEPIIEEPQDYTYLIEILNKLNNK